ncbi:MAG: hypothetical protein ACSHW0_02610 [Thalassotalea sp.]
MNLTLFLLKIECFFNVSYQYVDGDFTLNEGIGYAVNIEEKQAENTRYKSAYLPVYRLAAGTLW